MDDITDENDDMVEAPSPFIHNTNIQFALDSTSIGYFKTCPRLYYYIMIEGWQPKDESVHLTFGKLYHEALHIYDILRLTEKLDHEESVFQVVKWLLDYGVDYPDVSEGKPSIRAKSFQGLLDTVVGYLDKYPLEHEPAKTILRSDGKPACEVSFRFELDWQSYYSEETKSNVPYLLCGHLDRVVDFNGSLFVMDRKTTTSTPGAYYFNQWDPNNQMSLYTVAGQIVIGSPIKGVIIDVAQVKLKEPPEYVRGFTYRTPDQSAEWLAGLQTWTRAMESCALDDDWPMNDTACDKFGGCRFREVCSKSPSVRKNFLKSEFVQGEKWNPLKPR